MLNRRLSSLVIVSLWWGSGFFTGRGQVWVAIVLLVVAELVLAHYRDRLQRWV